MSWNRFDIVEAYYAYFTDYHTGQWSHDYARLCHMQTYFRPGDLWRGYDSLTENGQAIYDRLAAMEETP